MRSIAAVFALLCIVLPLGGDSWSLPMKTTLTSRNGEWTVTVTPRHLRSQLEYFEEKVAEEKAGVAATPVPANGAGAVLRKHGVQVAKWKLVNEVAPVSVLVGDDGTVVTFDNWHSKGWGDNVVVLYRNDGTLIAVHGLDDFLREADIERLSHSVSSIWWSGTHRIDEEKRQLILEVVHDEKVIHEVPIALEDGSVLEPKPKLFPDPRVIVTAAPSEVSRCGDMLALTGDELLAAATNAKPPAAYPEVARKVRIAGSVVLELIVRENGEVESVFVLKPLPFGLAEAAEKAAKEWRFSPFTRDGKPVRACAHVAVKFEL